MIRIGASTANFYPELTEKALDHVLSCGFRTLEVFVNTESELSPRFTHMLRQKADAAGARIVSLHPYSSGYEPFLLYSAYARRFEDGKALYARFFEAAAELGASVSQLDAQTRARGFYEKQGYRVCGEEHMDGHVPHVMMEKKLDGISNGFLGK